MKLRFTPRATQDLIDIAEYVRAENPAAALRVRAAIIESLELLVAFPALGVGQSVEDVRKLVTRKYRYIVYYAVAAEEISVLTIQHPARQQPGQALQRNPRK